jgi:plastocyanin
MKKSILLFTSVIAILLLLSACSKSDKQPVTGGAESKAAMSTAVPTDLAIDIKNFNFVPITATIKAGGTVTWTNSDNVQHQLISKDMFDSGPMDPGKTYSFTFGNPGTFDYNCSIHPTMLGKIVVVQ